MAGHGADAAAHVRGTEHQALLGTGWHDLTGAVMEMQWWSPSDVSCLSPGAAGGSADGDHPASGISTKA